MAPLREVEAESTMRGRRKRKRSNSSSSKPKTKKMKKKKKGIREESEERILIRRCENNNNSNSNPNSRRGEPKSESNDRLSSLPGDVLMLIISLLLPTDAPSILLLSKLWNTLWNTLWIRDSDISSSFPVLDYRKSKFAFCYLDGNSDVDDYYYDYDASDMSDRSADYDSELDSQHESVSSAISNFLLHENDGANTTKIHYLNSFCFRAPSSQVTFENVSLLIRYASGRHLRHLCLHFYRCYVPDPFLYMLFRACPLLVTLKLNIAAAQYDNYLLLLDDQGGEYSLKHLKVLHLRKCRLSNNSLNVLLSPASCPVLEELNLTAAQVPSSVHENN